MKNLKPYKILAAALFFQYTVGHTAALNTTTMASSSSSLSNGAATPTVSDPVPVRLEGGQLKIMGTLQDDKILVTLEDREFYLTQSGTPLIVKFNDNIFRYGSNLVQSVYIQGGAGNDVIVNETYKMSFISGSYGNDIIYGGSGLTFIYGDDGNDKLFGSSGIDYIYGGLGNDVIKGFGNNDHLFGGPGEDSLFGGTGNDLLAGESGKDTLISVGGGADTLNGGTETDYFWMDEFDTHTGIDYLEKAHVIKQFRGFSRDGGNTVTHIGLEPSGEDLPDPVLRVKHGLANFSLTGKPPRYILRSFKPNPLFSEHGAWRRRCISGVVSAIATLWPTF